MKTGSLRRLLGYTFRYKWSFFISVVGFIGFAFADIAAVESVSYTHLTLPSTHDV